MSIRKEELAALIKGKIGWVHSNTHTMSADAFATALADGIADTVMQRLNMGEAAKAPLDTDGGLPSSRSLGRNQADANRASPANHQPVEQPNLLRALIANDVMIRNMRHRDARWHDDELVKQLLEENTRCIQANSTKRESVEDRRKCKCGKKYHNSPAMMAHKLECTATERDGGE